MSIQVSWGNAEQTIILYTINGRWTWEQFYDAISQGRTMMESVAHPRVDFIVDMTRGKLLPGNALPQFARMSNNHHSKSGRMVIVGATGFIHALLNILGKHQQKTLRMIMAVQSLDDARDLLTVQQIFDRTSA